MVSMSVINLPYSACKIVAEIGLTHEGSVGFAENFITSAKKSGADIIKFQMHNSEHESSGLEKFRVPFSFQDKSRWDYWKRTSFTEENWLHLFDCVRRVNAITQVTIFDVIGLNFCIEAGITEIKLGSGDLRNEEILQELNALRKKGKLFNLTISTGMATYSEIEATLSQLDSLIKEKSVTVMQCTSMYPTPLELVGINAMQEIQSRFGVDVGLSDHSRGINAAIVAITHGATRVEKHIVFDHKMFGPDISSSIDFEELELLCNFRNDYALLSNRINKDEVSEKLSEQKMLFGRSLGLKQDFPSGHVLKVEDFCLRKPSGGLSWHERTKFVGRRLEQNYSSSELLTELHFTKP
jgi:N,N'-diacetyllegionaminate synthase